MPPTHDLIFLSQIASGAVVNCTFWFGNLSWFLSQIYVVDFLVNYIDPNYSVNFAVNYFELVYGKVDDGVSRLSLRQS